MSDSVRALAFSPNGQELATGLKNGDLVLLEFPAMKKIAELIGTGEAIHEIKFSPKGLKLCSQFFSVKLGLIISVASEEMCNLA